MFVQEIPRFTPERIHEQAQGNTNAVICTTIAYLKARGLSIADYAAFVGQTFAPTWDMVQRISPREMAEGAVLNLLAGGADILEFTGNDQEATFLATSCPPADALELAGITYADADGFNDVFHAIAGACGLQFEQQRTGDQLRLRFWR